MPVLQKKALFSAFIICQVLRIIQNYMEVSPAKSLILSATIHGGSYFFIQPPAIMSNLNYSIPHFKTPFLSCKYSQSSFSPTTYTVSSFHFSTVATYFSYIYYHNTIVIHICKFYFFPLFHLIIISPKPFQSITSVKNISFPVHLQGT